MRGGEHLVSINDDSGAPQLPVEQHGRHERSLLNVGGDGMWR